MRRYDPVRTLKAKVPELDYVACSSVWLSHPTWSKATHNVWATHQLPLYYQLQLVAQTAWTALVTWYMPRKVACTKILPNFWVAQVIVKLLCYEFVLIKLGWSVPLFVFGVVTYFIRITDLFLYGLCGSHNVSINLFSDYLQV